MSVLTPNMNLVQSTIGVDSGLNWEMNLNSSLTTLDQHNHSSGNGVKIQPSGLNINSDLTFNNNPASGLQCALFIDQPSLPTLNALYTIAGELYFNDPTGPVQITLGGAVNATSSGISSGTASAAFSAGILVVNSAPNTPANIQVGSVLLGNNSAGSQFLTLSPPPAMGASFGLTLPNLPGATSFVTLDTSGNISGSIPISGGIVAANISPTAGIVGTQLSASANILGSQLDPSANIVGTQLSPTANIAQTQLAANGVQQAAASGSFSSASTSPVTITNQSVSFASNGRPVMLMVSGGYFSATSVNNVADVFYGFTRNGSPISASRLTLATQAPAGCETDCPAGALFFMDVVGAGTYTYTIYAYVNGAGSTVLASNVRLTVYNLA